MNNQSKLLSIIILFTLGIIFIVISLFSVIKAGNDNTCPQDSPWTKIDSDDLSTYPVDGAVEYCFKFGSENSQGCIGGLSNVWPPEVDGKYCGLSHWSYYIPETSPSPTNTSSPLPSPQVSPSSSTSPSPEPSETPESSPGPSPVPSPSPSPTATPRPSEIPTNTPEPSSVPLPDRGVEILGPQK